MMDIFAELFLCLYNHQAVQALPPTGLQDV